MAQPMGLGLLGNPSLAIKRPFRWTMTITNICNNPQKTIPEAFIQTAGRPKWSQDEQEINFLHGKRFIPGKVTYDPISVSIIDVAHISNKNLWDWLASAYNFTNPTTLYMGTSSLSYSATAYLTMWDGCGSPIETWTYFDVWPKDVDFGEVDHSNSEPMKINLTLRYQSILYTSKCPGYTINPCCSDCNGNVTT